MNSMIKHAMNKARFETRVEERRARKWAQRIKGACDGDKPVGRERFTLGQFAEAWEKYGGAW